jgi:hypothetical protein
LATKTTSELLRDTMVRNKIGPMMLRDKAKSIAIDEIDRDMDRFLNGGAISLTIAAAIIMLIVEWKKDSAVG